MTDPITAKVIKITVTDGVLGQPITVLNRTTGEFQNLTLQKTGAAVADLQNFPSGYEATNVIDVIVTGGKVGHSSFTASAGSAGQSVTITTASNNATGRGI